jgi:hypothetical protein
MWFNFVEVFQQSVKWFILVKKLGVRIILIFCLMLCALLGYSQNPFTKGVYIPDNDPHCGIESGSLTIDSINGRNFYFHIQVKGHRGHSGEIDGWAEVWTGKYAIYEEKIIEDSIPIYLKLEFYISPDDKYIHIVGDNTLYYHGAAVCFEAFYKK